MSPRKPRPIYYEIRFQSPTVEEALHVRQDLFDHYGEHITSSSSDPRQKGKYWYEIEVKGGRNKNTIRNYLDEHPDVLLVTVRKQKAYKG